jgi:cobalt-zinc-cadmium efflux system protein
VGAGHSHIDQREQNRSRIGAVLVLVTLYMVAEVVGGLLTNSLALLADAGHMLSDAAALALALLAMWMAGRQSGERHTYGYYRAEILAAALNAGTLVAVAVYIFVEAARRIGEPPEVQGALMMTIAVGGLLVNLLGLRILTASQQESLNVRGAWLHVLTDAMGSAGAIVAGGLIWALGWNWVDPAASILIGILVLYSAWKLLRESVDVLMEAAPPHIDLASVSSTITAVPGVEGVHDLHVWTITSGLLSLSAHVTVTEERFDQATIAEVRDRLHHEFDIDHATIQLETATFSECSPTV